ncbi:hypothetical protein D3C87_1884130 [compost metagenome]
MIEPVIEPMPPKTTMITAFTLVKNPNEEGLMKFVKKANSPPATPAKKLERTKAFTFICVVLTPIASAAISSSRTLKNPRP